MNNAAVASAIAARFAAATPPTGYPAIALSTYQLPQSITATPALLVYPPEEPFSYYPGGMRSGTQTWPVRFYLAPAGDIKASWDALYAWHDVLIEALVGSVTLSQSANGVEWSRISFMNPGWRLPYGGVEYLGLEMSVEVTVASATNPTG